jgi:hypothetical protein
MSFFSSLQQYVTSGVAGLALNRRFSRQDSQENSTTAASNTTTTSTIAVATDKSAISNSTTPVHGEVPSSFKIN